MYRLAIAWLVVLVACTQTVADDAVRACQPLCGCAVPPLPGVQRECAAECVDDFERMPLDEGCILCIVDHSDRCATLLDDCRLPCSLAAPLPSYVNASALPGIDR